MGSRPSLVLWTLLVATHFVSAAEPEADEPPTLLVVHRDSKFDIDRIFDAANRDYIVRRIPDTKAHIARNAPEHTIRMRHELASLEKALSGLKPSGRPFKGTQYVTVFEHQEYFVVSYFSLMTMDQFITLISKRDYSPLSEEKARRWLSSNITQKTLVLE